MNIGGLIAVSVALQFLLPAGVAGAYEQDVDRPGNDYTRFEAGTPDACSAACGRNSTLCAAWTWVKPGVQGPAAQCWLKDKIPPKRSSNCCVSGVNQLWFQRHF